jgi:hypothetical protein
MVTVHPTKFDWKLDVYSGNSSGVGGEPGSTPSGTPTLGHTLALNDASPLPTRSQRLHAAGARLPTSPLTRLPASHVFESGHQPQPSAGSAPPHAAHELNALQPLHVLALATVHAPAAVSAWHDPLHQPHTGSALHEPQSYTCKRGRS